MKNKAAEREPLKWYEKASKKHFSQEEKKSKRSDDAAQQPSTMHSASRSQQTVHYGSAVTTHRIPAIYHSSAEEHSPLIAQSSLFNTTALPHDAAEALACFDKILSSSHPLSSKQRVLLPQQIRSLSHNLTDERSDRRLGYMNQTTTLSAYVYYYMWWNLVRLTRLFANLPAASFAIKDDAICLDIGSGPLTVPTALFLARPDLRKKHLTWYCLDLSSSALAEGENIFLSTAAQLRCEPWKIIRVKGEIGTPIKERASFVTCANVFNEIVEDFTMPPDYLAKKYCEKILSYVTRNNNDVTKANNVSETDDTYPTANDISTHVLVVEPGVPKSARFISLLRDALIRRDFTPDAPCTHCSNCPMDGKKGGKWCNFAFSTDNAPAALKKLSEQSQLPKERAVLSFVMASQCEATVAKEKQFAEKENPILKKSNALETAQLSFRIASDPIRLPGDRTGYYACSEKGLLLVVTQRHLASGEGFKIKTPDRMDHIDAKSGAIVIDMN